MTALASPRAAALGISSPNAHSNAAVVGFVSSATHASRLRERLSQEPRDGQGQTPAEAEVVCAGAEAPQSADIERGTDASNDTGETTSTSPGIVAAVATPSEAESTGVGTP
ncbi:unnamed protein product, partial [Ectocarpus sp. 12 AP-2014]